MSHLDYIVSAYVLTIGGLGGLVLVSWLRMKAAEKAAEMMKERRR